MKTKVEQERIKKMGEIKEKAKNAIQNQVRGR